MCGDQWAGGRDQGHGLSPCRACSKGSPDEWKLGGGKEPQISKLLMSGTELLQQGAGEVTDAGGLPFPVRYHSPGVGADGRGSLYFWLDMQSRASESLSLASMGNERVRAPMPQTLNAVTEIQTLRVNVSLFAVLF